MSKSQDGNVLEHTTSSDASNPTSSKLSAGSESKSDDAIKSHVPAMKMKRPASPYHVGSTFLAKQHIPPAPCGSRYRRIRNLPLKSPETNHMSTVEYCLFQGPLEGSILNEDLKELKITANIRTGTEFGAQVVVVNDNMVAKIFDPMYYRVLDGWGIWRDVVACADGDYSREAAAYQALASCSEVQPYVPMYYGCWTIKVPLPPGLETKTGEAFRHVRLILMEYVNGTPMDKIKPQKLSQEARLNILKKALEAEAMISFAGVTHDDLSPRNIICVGDDLSSSSAKAIMIDFNVAFVRSIVYPEYNQIWEGVPSPCYRWWGNLLEFHSRGWISADYEQTNKWLWDSFGHDDRYMKVERKMTEKGLGSPQLVGEDELEDEQFPQLEESVQTIECAAPAADRTFAGYHIV